LLEWDAAAYAKSSLFRHFPAALAANAEMRRKCGSPNGIRRWISGYNLGIMRYYAIAAVLLLVFAYVVARHNGIAASEAVQECAVPPQPAPAKPREERPSKGPENSFWDGPNGRMFQAAFSWPEGVTAWAILLTLIAVADQARQTARAAQATQDAAAIERDAFIQSQRPKISVRDLSLSSPAGDAPPLRRITGGWHSGQFSITNTGGTTAKVIEVLCICRVLDALPARHPWEGEAGKKVEFSLRPGLSQTYSFAVDTAPGDSDLGEILTSHKNFYVMGRIDYEDGSGFRRTTRFCPLFAGRK